MDRLQCDDALDILPEHIKDHVREKEVEGPFTDNSTTMGGRPVELARVHGMTVERARQFISWAEVTRNYDSDAYVSGEDAERAVALANQEYGYGRVVIVMWPKVAAMAREQDEAARVPIARIMVVLQVGSGEAATGRWGKGGRVTAPSRWLRLRQTTKPMLHSPASRMTWSPGQTMLVRVQNGRFVSRIRRSLKCLDNSFISI